MILNGNGVLGRDREVFDCVVTRLRGRTILGKAIFLFVFSGGLWDFNCFFPVAREAFPLGVNFKYLVKSLIIGILAEKVQPFLFMPLIVSMPLIALQAFIFRSFQFRFPLTTPQG
ncbi:MAG TPA: hypothetical protein DD706_10510 [Nitrospiraceae bacterium]|nr:hypothetical protein [Nitrospiraceae bacterium]